MHFPGEDPIGRRIKLNPDLPSSPPVRAPVWVAIVGIAPTIRQRNDTEADPDPVVYLPIRADTPSYVALMKREDAAAPQA